MVEMSMLMTPKKRILLASIVMGPIRSMEYFEVGIGRAKIFRFRVGVRSVACRLGLVRFGNRNQNFNPDQIRVGANPFLIGSDPTFVWSWKKYFLTLLI